MPETGLKSNRRLLVLGLGNYLCGDDSIGFRLAEKLSSSYFHPQVDIINGAPWVWACYTFLRNTAI